MSECSVCYTELTQQTDSYLECGHPLCIHCLFQMQSPICPICRTDLDSTLIDLTPYLNFIEYRQHQPELESKSCIYFKFITLLLISAGIEGNFLYVLFAAHDCFNNHASLLLNYVFWGFVVSNFFIIYTLTKYAQHNMRVPRPMS